MEGALVLHMVHVHAADTYGRDRIDAELARTPADWIALAAAIDQAEATERAQRAKWARWGVTTREEWAELVAVGVIDPEE